MKLDKEQARDLTAAGHRADLHGSQRRTLEAIFRHPAASKLEWMDVVDLVGRIGSMSEKGSGKFDLHVGGKHHLMHKPHTKDLTGLELLDLRHFLQQAGWSPEETSQADHHPDPTPPTLMVVVDHHGAKIYRLDPDVDDAEKQLIRPYDPHSLLHELAHKVQAAEQQHHVPEEVAFYGRIADAVAAGGRIIVVSHATTQHPVARHLAEYLRTHHGRTYQRVVYELTANLSGMTLPQLQALAQQALSQKAKAPTV
jgi:hypothetical protein